MFPSCASRLFSSRCAVVAGHIGQTNIIGEFVIQSAVNQSLVMDEEREGHSLLHDGVIGLESPLVELLHVPDELATHHRRTPGYSWMFLFVLDFTVDVLCGHPLVVRAREVPPVHQRHFPRRHGTAVIIPPRLLRGRVHDRERPKVRLLHLPPLALPPVLLADHLRRVVLLRVVRDDVRDPSRGHVPRVVGDRGAESDRDPRKARDLRRAESLADGLVEVYGGSLQQPAIDELAVDLLNYGDVVVEELRIVEVEVAPGGGLLDFEGGEYRRGKWAGVGRPVGEDDVGEANCGPILRFGVLVR